MCGLFGMIQAEHSSETDALRWAEAMLTLGTLAEERGVDAAGVAILPTATQESLNPGWHTTRTLGSFSQLVGAGLVSGLTEARAILGHTRQATQGAINLINTSPMRVGSLIGTHNGDVNIDPLKPLIAPDFQRTGTTDTEILLAAVAAAPRTLSAVREVLTSVEGRAAMAWTDIRHPQTVWLARAGMSPLAVARNAAGAVVWASNPQWLLDIESTFHLGLRSPRMLREGTVLRVVGHQGRPMVQRGARFTPTVRHLDIQEAEKIGWDYFGVFSRGSLRQSHHRVMAPQG